MKSLQLLQLLFEPKEKSMELLVTHEEVTEDGAVTVERQSETPYSVLYLNYLNSFLQDSTR